MSNDAHIPDPDPTESDDVAEHDATDEGMPQSPTEAETGDAE
ncbi:hypothetical protein [Demetria terragena]|nr:hypothetical protein [Demetria terragena]